MIAWFTKNDVAANLLMIMIVFVGLFSAFNLVPLEIFPSYEKDEVKVTMNIKGSTPEDTEQSVTIRIEEAIADLEGIKEIRSVSSEKSASVFAEIDDGYDNNELLADIKSRVDSVNTFPEEAEKPIIEKVIRKRDVIVVTLSSIYSEKETKEYAQVVRDRLLQTDGVTQVEIKGVRDYEVSVEVSQDILLEYGLTLEDISKAINGFSLDSSAGNLKTNSGDVLIRLKSQGETKDDFENIVVRRNVDGSIIYLKDIATIVDGFEETPIKSRFNGKNAVFIDVFRVGNQSAIEVADKVKEFIVKEQENLPAGFELSYWDDDSIIVKNRLNILLDSAVQGSILIIIILTLFLRPTIAFWVFLGIPVSFAGAFFIMPLFDVTLNNLSLFAFILVLGIVVDDAIVTGENIYTHLEKAPSGEIAAIEGTKEIAAPVTFGVLTTIAAFLPLAFVEGQRSMIFTQIPYVVIPVLLFSLIESKFILPAHLKHIKLRKEKEKVSWFSKWQQKFADGFEKGILKYYKPLLKVAISNKITTVLIFTSILTILITLFIGGWTRFVFFPKIPSETVRVSLSMPAGTPFEVTDKHIEHIAKQAQVLKERHIDQLTNESVITNILVITGGRGEVSHEGSVRFELTPAEQRVNSVTSIQLANELRKLIGNIPGAEKLELRAEFGRGDSPIDVELTSNNLDVLKKVANEIKIKLASFNTVYEISDNLSNGKEEIKIELTKEGELLGITKQNIANQLKASIYGIQVQSMQRGRDDVKVMLRLPKEQRQSWANLNNIMITSSNGDKIPLSNVATLVSDKGPVSINRTNRFRTANVTAEVDKETANMFAIKAELEEYLDELLLKYPGVEYSLEGENKEQEETFGSLFYALIFSLFCIYVLLAIPFKSYIQPLIVMSVIPFGIIGAFIGHYLLGKDLTILSLMGMLALTGVIVNDSLVLVDYINKQYKKTNDLLNSVLTAGAARFRPVILTSLTTFIGLLPLLFEKSTGAQFLIPMAISLGFGILFATFSTLLLVPVNYMLLDKVKRFFKDV